MFLLFFTQYILANCPPEKEVAKSLKTIPNLELCYAINFFEGGRNIRYRIGYFSAGSERKIGIKAPLKLSLKNITIHNKEVCSYSGKNFALDLVDENDFNDFWAVQYKLSLGSNYSHDRCPPITTINMLRH